MDRFRGIERTAPSAPAAAHVETLLAAGASIRAIAETAGVSPSLVCRLRGRVQTRMRRDTANKVLSVTPEKILTRSRQAGFVPALGARRRIQALLAIGWTHNQISSHMPIASSSQLVLSQRGEWITRTTHDAIAAAYNKLAMTPGTSWRTRSRAAKAGYLSPLAWDDIDNPNDNPGTALVDEAYLDHAAIDRRAAGDRTVRITPAEATEVIGSLRRQGYSDAEISRRTGLKVDRYAIAQRDLKEVS
jgi:hypothetical protein